METMEVHPVGRLLQDKNDQTLLRRLLRATNSYQPAQEIVTEGQELRQALVLIKGWAMRVRLLSDGRRQIISFLLPLDPITATPMVIGLADHSVVALTDCRVAAFPASELLTICRRSADLHLFFSWMADHQQAVLQEHVVSLGQKGAKERLCSLLLELSHRLDLIGEGLPQAALPLSRAELADALGLSPRHLSRVIQELEAEGVVRLQDHTFDILDCRRLRELAELDALHLQLSDNVRRVKEQLREALDR